jgi:hypothetical protein
VPVVYSSALLEARESRALMRETTAAMEPRSLPTGRTQVSLPDDRTNGSVWWDVTNDGRIIACSSNAVPAPKQYGTTVHAGTGTVLATR